MKVVLFILLKYSYCYKTIKKTKKHDGGIIYFTATVT